ncbi:endosome-associated-trafficking regulator 1-like [Mya arenaria]|uniref:endosome-associated-trafficking regulator 1-like n=1 Tax=Mya arenaria TaxID=6604 RepID=UPI0022E57DE2|nr:endosome-associated-trafficking regulator 1-like [Mya arenaria]
MFGQNVELNKHSTANHKSKYIYFFNNCSLNPGSMAEGGEKSDENNPFSFKSFVTKKDKSVTEHEKPSNEDDLDIFNTPDVSSLRKRDKPKQIVVVDEENAENPKQKKKGKGENPFSFKKFLSGSNTKSSENRPAPETSMEKRTKPRKKMEPDGVNNIQMVAGDLPDFVQGHYSDSNSERFGDNDHSNTGFVLPDFALDSRGASTVNDGSLNKTLGAEENISEVETRMDDFVDSSDGEDIHSSRGNLLNSLPDFLSDAALSNGRASDNTSVSRQLPVIEADEQACDSKQKQLQDENRALRQQVEELKRRNHQCDNRVGDLERQLERQKAKEAEENAVMERAMEQVEENLSQTTKRAVQAETMVTKLKQDVKGLQAEMGKLRGENRMLLSGDKYLGDIKERTGYVAEQLSSATNTAETSLKQLLSGLDQLKMLSLVLTSIDKITEDTSSSDSSKPNA